MSFRPIHCDNCAQNEANLRRLEAEVIQADKIIADMRREIVELTNRKPQSRKRSDQRNPQS